MATAKLTHLFSAYFEDGHIIDQSQDDRYSKHDESAEWNPSAFRDVLEYEKAPLQHFHLLGPKNDDIYVVSLDTGIFTVHGKQFSLETVNLTNRKIIYYRETKRDIIGGEWQEAVVSRYAIGYEGRTPDGKIQKKVVYVNG